MFIKFHKFGKEFPSIFEVMVGLMLVCKTKALAPSSVNPSYESLVWLQNR